MSKAALPDLNMECVAARSVDAGKTVPARRLRLTKPDGRVFDVEIAGESESEVLDDMVHNLKLQSEQIAELKKTAASAVETKWRANYVAAPQFFALNHACLVINKAFGGGGGHCYLVGSSLSHKDYRDVDVRFIMPDEEFDRFFRTSEDVEWQNPLWSLLCTTISAWLSQQSQLQVDFQIQRQTQANERHPGPGKRSALGIFLDYPGERPSDIAPIATSEKQT